MTSFQQRNPIQWHSHIILLSSKIQQTKILIRFDFLVDLRWSDSFTQIRHNIMRVVQNYNYYLQKQYNQVLKEMAHFTGWGVFGTLCGHPWDFGSVSRGMGGCHRKKTQISYLACELQCIGNFKNQYLTISLFLLKPPKLYCSFHLNAILVFFFRCDQAYVVGIIFLIRIELTPPLLLIRIGLTHLDLGGLSTQGGRQVVKGKILSPQLLFDP